MLTLPAEITFDQPNLSAEAFVKMFSECRIVTQTHEETKRTPNGQLEIPPASDTEKPTKTPIYLVQNYRRDEARVTFPNGAIITLRNTVLVRAYKETELGFLEELETT